MIKRTQALWHRQKHLTTRLAVINILGGVCKACGFSDIRALQIDHIYGGGNRETKKYGGYAINTILKKLQKGDTTYQLLCANCNWIKKYEKKENTPRLYTGEWERKPLAPCGTHSAYRRGCRCEACYVAHRSYCRNAQRKARNSSREKNNSLRVDPAIHGAS